MPQRFLQTGITDFVRKHANLSARHPEKEIQRLVRKANKQFIPSKSLYVIYYKLRREAREKMASSFVKPPMYKVFTPKPKGLPFGVFPGRSEVTRFVFVDRGGALPRIEVAA